MHQRKVSSAQLSPVCTLKKERDLMSEESPLVIPCLTEYQVSGYNSFSAEGRTIDLSEKSLKLEKSGKGKIECALSLFMKSALKNVESQFRDQHVNRCIQKARKAKTFFDSQSEPKQTSLYEEIIKNKKLIEADNPKKEEKKKKTKDSNYSKFISIYQRKNNCLTPQTTAPPLKSSKTEAKYTQSKWKPIQLESRRAGSRDIVKEKRRVESRSKSRKSREPSRRKQGDALPSWLQLVSKPTISSQAKVKKYCNQSPGFLTQSQECSTLESSGSQVEIVAKLFGKSKHLEEPRASRKEVRQTGLKIQNQSVGASTNTNRGYDTPSFKEQQYRRKESPPRFQLSPHMLEASLKLDTYSPPPLKSCQKRINKEVGSGKIVRKSPKVFQRLKEEELERKIEQFKIKYCINNCEQKESEETQEFSDLLLTKRDQRKHIREMARKKHQIDQEFNRETRSYSSQMKFREPPRKQPPTWILMRQFYRIQQKVSRGMIRRPW